MGAFCIRYAVSDKSSVLVVNKNIFVECATREIAENLALQYAVADLIANECGFHGNGIIHAWVKDDEEVFNG